MDSDGMGFFATGLLFMFITYSICKFFLDNMLVLFIAFIVFIALFFLYDSYGYDLKVKFDKWLQGLVSRTLYKYFKVSLRNNKVWYFYAIIVSCLQMGFNFIIFLVVLRVIAYML